MHILDMKCYVNRQLLEVIRNKKMKTVQYCLTLKMINKSYKNKNHEYEREGYR